MGITPAAQLRGIPGSPGLALGPVFIYRPATLAIPGHTISAEESEAEWGRVQEAIAAAVNELETLQEQTAERLGAGEAEIFLAHQLLLQDPALLDDIQTGIIQGQHNAAQAVQGAIERAAATLLSLEDEYFRARAADLRDVGGRLLRHLLGVAQSGLQGLTTPSIIVAADLTPSDTAGLKIEVVLGLVTEQGGPTSHVAILARQMGLPAVLGIKDALARLAGATLVALDGGAGTVFLDPDAGQQEAFSRRKEAEAGRQALLDTLVTLPAITQDGHTIELAANLGRPGEAAAAAGRGAVGVGLFRTEFLFLDRTSPPSEDEQAMAYGMVAAAFPPPGRVIIRALDIGGDKVIPYLAQAEEANPFLGVRGVRLLLAQPALLRAQVRAILRAAGTENRELCLMLPMVSDRDEIEQVRAIIAEEREALQTQAMPAGVIQFGIMVETPAAAVCASLLAPYVDFFSIGTNDLTQYTLAADRLNSQVAALYQPYHPAILRLIQMVADAAHAHQGWVGMCGELAGEALATPLLVGLRLHELSMESRSLPAVKEALRALTFSQAQQIAAHCLTLESAAAIKKYLYAVQGELGISSAIS